MGSVIVAATNDGWCDSKPVLGESSSGARVVMMMMMTLYYLSLHIGFANRLEAFFWLLTGIIGNDAVATKGPRRDVP